MNPMEFLRNFFNPPEPQPPDQQAFARVMLAMHNSERTSHNVPKLQLNDRLINAAVQHAKWMHDSKRLTHIGINSSSALDRVAHQHYRLRALGENIASGYHTISGVMAAWVISSGHRKIILGNYEEAGFGRTGDYWCALFGLPGWTDDDTIIISYGGPLRQDQD